MNDREVRTSADAELRAVVAASLERLDRDLGGRQLGRVAAALGVHRSTVSRWRSAAAAPSFDWCMALSERYPDHFDKTTLVGLLTSAALGNEQPAPAAPASVRLTGHTFAAMVAALIAALEREPEAAADREVLHITLEAEAERLPAPGGTVFENAEDLELRFRFQEVMDRRAREGWRMRTVMNTFGRHRFESLELMAARLDGPDVEIRAYATSVPLVISQFVIARREVIVGFNPGLQAKPTPAMMHLESPEAVAWATRYFDQLFDDAPFHLRGPGGISTSEFARLHTAIGMAS